MTLIGLAVLATYAASCAAGPPSVYLLTVVPHTLPPWYRLGCCCSLLALGISVGLWVARWQVSP